MHGSETFDSQSVLHVVLTDHQIRLNIIEGGNMTNGNKHLHAIYAFGENHGRTVWNQYCASEYEDALTLMYDDHEIMDCLPVYANRILNLVPVRNHAVFRSIDDETCLLIIHCDRTALFKHRSGSTETAVERISALDAAWKKAEDFDALILGETPFSQEVREQYCKSADWVHIWNSSCISGADNA